MSITEYTAGTRLACHNQANRATIAMVAKTGRASPPHPLAASGDASLGRVAIRLGGHHTGAAAGVSFCSTAAGAAARNR
jgi:hypothetical protein